jgi:hypothetical protein
MHAGSELVGIGDAGEQGAQLGALLGGEVPADRVVVGPSHLRHPAEQPLARRGEVQRVQPPVVRVAAAFEQAALGQRVDEADQPARRRAEQPGQRLLAPTRSRPRRPGAGRSAAA